jgi:cell fate regulator YaaT (PSP1 superfamily)
MCCSTFLQEFEPVTLRAAKDQDLSLNPSNISGCCGRLMCCLIYERDFYLECKKIYPDIGKEVITKKGKEKVKSVDVFSGKIELISENGNKREVFISELKREMKEVE